jgi:hypothetical protein
MLDNTLMLDFMSGFYGYGNYRADVWFIGMEEGGGGSFGEVATRLSHWDKRGRMELEDARAYHLAIGMPRFFQQPVSLQNTWKQLIRVYLSLQKLPVSIEEIRGFQMNHLGQHNGDTALLELMPLPSPGRREWHYSQWSGLSNLHSRETYYQSTMPGRIHHLWARITEHQPRFVILYGLTCLSHYEQVAGGSFSKDTAYGIYTRVDEAILFAAIKHPAAMGASNQYFEEVGAYLRS